MISFPDFFIYQKLKNSHNFSSLSFYLVFQNTKRLNEPYRSSHPRCSIKKGVLKNFAKFTGKHLCQSLFFNKVDSETLAQMFSSEFCEIFKNTLFTVHLWTTASDPENFSPHT